MTTITNVNFNNKTIEELIARIDEEKERLVPNCFSCTSRCGRNDSFDMESVWQGDEEIRTQ